MDYKGIKVSFEGFKPSKEEIQKYCDYIIQKRNCKMSDISTLKLKVEEDSPNSVLLDYTLHERKFERIRRITGYLVGTVDRWNDAKRAELDDRVKHI